MAMAKAAKQIIFSMANKLGLAADICAALAVAKVRIPIEPDQSFR